MPKGYQRQKTSVHLMNYHFVWCPKYRRPILQGPVAARCRQLMEEKMREMGCNTLQVEIMPDHIHLFLQGHPKIAPNNIIAAIKGYTSHKLRKEFPQLLRMPTLWTRSYFVSTAGNVSSHVIQKYIREQKGR